MTARMLKNYLENRKEGYTYVDPKFPNIQVEFEFWEWDENGNYIPEENASKFDAVNIMIVNIGAIYQVRFNGNIDKTLEKVARTFNKLSKMYSLVK